VSEREKHTPGPWKVIDAGSGHYFDVVGGVRDTAGIPDVRPGDEIYARVCRVFRGTDGPANAALILAAPGLLEALKRAAVFIGSRCGCGDPEQCVTCQAYHEAANAVAKYEANATKGG
jgi:hypothetical protein